MPCSEERHALFGTTPPTDAERYDALGSMVHADYIWRGQRRGRIYGELVAWTAGYAEVKTEDLGNVEADPTTITKEPT